MEAFDEGYGRHYGKYDIERIGIFGELSYMNGKGYVSPFAPDKKDPRTKGFQMLSGVPKIKTGLGDCYFDHDFHRLFIAEAWINPTTVKRAQRLADLKKRPTDADFIPAPGPKKRSGSGDYYGTFGGVVSEFSPLTRKVPKRKREPANFLTNPGKKGCSTYPDICFTKYPTHLEDKFGGDPAKLKELRSSAKQLAGPFIGISYPALFDKNPNYAIGEDKPYYIKPPKEKVRVVGTGIWIPSAPAKKDGGCKAGTLNKWPEHRPDTDKAPKKKKQAELIFYPQARNKTMYTQSVSFKQIDRTLNNTNWLTYNHKSFPNVQ